VAPWSLTPGQSTQVCATYNDVITNCLTWPVAQTAPGVFTVDGTYAAAINQDGTVNSVNHPAPVGSIIAVWATGLGAIAPAQADGTLVGLPLPDDMLPGTVESLWVIPGTYPDGLGEQRIVTPLTVTYAGPAPYMVAGASQINFQVIDYHAGTPLDGRLYVNLLPETSVASLPFQVYVSGQ
jgi:uncharacterized protein (TIGR03437 family)